MFASRFNSLKGRIDSFLKDVDYLYWFFWLLGAALAIFGLASNPGASGFFEKYGSFFPLLVPIFVCAFIWRGLFEPECEKEHYETAVVVFLFAVFCALASTALHYVFSVSSHIHFFVPLGATLPFVFAYWIISGLLWERRFERDLAAADPADLQALYSALADVSELPPTGYRLGRLGEPCEPDICHVYIPKELDLPWAGLTLSLTHMDMKDYPEVSVVPNSSERSKVYGSLYVHVPVPRVRRKKGKPINRRQMKYYLSNQKVVETLGKMFSSNKQEALLNSLLEPTMIGMYPDWLQSPEFVKCPTCKKRMHHIFQTYPDDAHGGGNCTVYVFGCLTHVDQLKTVTQCT